jgi:hypothetical protein
MSFKTGSVAYMKTTEEPVLVLATETKDPAFEGFSGEVITVRRPHVTPDGIDYIIATFYAEELESADDKAQRFYNEMTGRVRQFEAQNGKPETTSALPS